MLKDEDKKHISNGNLLLYSGAHKRETKQQPGLAIARPSNQMPLMSLSTFFVGLECIPPRIPSVAIISIFDFDIVGLSGVIDWLRLWRRSEIIGQIIFKSPFISRSKRGDGKKCQMKLAHNTNNFFQFV